MATQVYGPGDKETAYTMNENTRCSGTCATSPPIRPETWPRRKMASLVGTSCATRIRCSTMFARGSTEADPTRYTQLFQQMQTMVVTDVAEIGLVARNNVAAASKRLSGYEPRHRWRSFR